MESSDLITILRALPEKRLKLIDVAHQLITEDGLDIKKAAGMQKEIDAAADQASAYVEASRRIKLGLKKLLDDR